MIFRGLSAGLVCEPLACYRVHPDSLSTDRVALRRSELLVLQRAASSDLPMTTSERLALERSLARHQRQSRLEDLRAALARDAPEVRRLARGVASEPGYPVPHALEGGGGRGDSGSVGAPAAAPAACAVDRRCARQSRTRLTKHCFSLRWRLPIRLRLAAAGH